MLLAILRKIVVALVAGLLVSAAGELSAQQVGFVDHPLTSSTSEPTGITTGSDGALWFTEYNANKVGRLTTAGVITDFSIPTPRAMPFNITSGPDGAIWFTEDEKATIGRLTTTGVFSEFKLANPTSLPEAITTGSDGALWLTDFTGDDIGRITTAGAITEYPLAAGDSTPEGITLGPDGRIWFTENASAEIGQVVKTSAVLTSDPNRGYPSTKCLLAGTGFAIGETVNIYWDSNSGNLLSSVDADNTGTFAVSVPAHPEPYGTSSFVAVGQTSGKIGSQTSSSRQSWFPPLRQARRAPPSISKALDSALKMSSNVFGINHPTHL